MFIDTLYPFHHRLCTDLLCTFDPGRPLGAVLSPDPKSMDDVLRIIDLQDEEVPEAEAVLPAECYRVAYLDVVHDPSIPLSTVTLHERQRKEQYIRHPSPCLATQGGAAAIFPGLPLGFCEVFSISMGYHLSEALNLFLGIENKCAGTTFSCSFCEKINLKKV